MILTDPQDSTSLFARQGPVDGLHILRFTRQELADAFLDEPDIPAGALVQCFDLGELLAAIFDLDQEVYTDVVTDPNVGPDWFEENRRVDLDDLIHLLLGLVGDLEADKKRALDSPGSPDSGT